MYFSERYGFYALSRYADVRAAHGDPLRFVSSYGVTVEMLMRREQLHTNMLILMDPPEHTHQRKLVGNVFTRRAIEGLEPLVAEVVIGYLDRLEGRDRFDLIADFAALFPVHVISALLGVPVGDREKMRHWVDTFLHREEGNPNTTEAGIEAYTEMVDYFVDLTRAKRADPDGLLISTLIEAEVADHAGNARRLADEDVVAFALLLGGAGSETVTKLLGSGMVLLDGHPEQMVAVRADPDLIPAAIEEMLRMHPPSQYQGRYCTEDVSFEGGTIPAGHPVLLLTGAATRDPRVYDDPDRFDISRGSHASLAFGYGVHTCLGAWLARLESRLAIAEILRRWPAIEVDHAGLRRVNMANVAGFANVPVSVG